MKLKFVFSLFPLIMLGTSVSAQILDQSLCEQCLTTSKAELTKCLEAAISQEDKRSCLERKETRAGTCENECKIVKAAESAIIREGQSLTHRTPRV